MSADESTTDGDEKSARQKVGEGVRDGIGVLSAFKEALEETIKEARERGDLSAERAKEVVRGALDRAQAAAAEAKGRLDFVQHAELEGLEASLEDLRARVSALEEKVFAPGSESAP